jgi:hypothetical protein
MINESVPVTFKDGAIASLVVPKHTIAYAIVQDKTDRVLVLTVQKTIKDRSGLAALLRAKAKFPDLVFQTTSGISCGVMKAGAPHPYWKALLLREDDNKLRLSINPKDPMLGAYGYITDREAAVGMGEEESDMATFILDIVDPDRKRIRPEKNEAITKPAQA